MGQRHCLDLWLLSLCWRPWRPLHRRWQLERPSINLRQEDPRPTDPDPCAVSPEHEAQEPTAKARVHQEDHHR